MPELTNTRDKALKLSKRSAKPRCAAAATALCSRQKGGTAVATDKSLGFKGMGAFKWGTARQTVAPTGNTNNVTTEQVFSVESTNVLSVELR